MTAAKSDELDKTTQVKLVLPNRQESKMQHKENLAQHPARTKLDVISRTSPKGLWNAFEEARRKTPPTLDQEYLGIEEGRKVVLNAYGEALITRALANLTPTQFENAISTFLTLATWRISQGIYRFDPDVYECVIDSLIDSEIPGDLLLRLPERCLFVETPGLEFTFTNGTRSPIQGVWARVESITDSADIALVMQPLLTGTAPDVFLHAFRMSVSGGIDRWDEVTIENTAEVLAKSGRAPDKDKIRQSLTNMKTWTVPVLNLLLYLCSENSEIGGGSQRPHIAAPKVVKGIPRFFPANHPTKWDVGVRFGAALRIARQSDSNSMGGLSAEKRPHIRRAHWHGVRVGPMKHPDGTQIPTCERRFELRWLPPIPVKVQSIDELPATIRPVT
jgi:hypothetical protein